VERQIGRKPIELIGPEFPELLERVWFAFFDLNSTRGVGPSGPNPITYSEIKDYIELTGKALRPHEVEAVKRLDRIYLKVAHSD
jgi:hypothetical protein